MAEEPQQQHRAEKEFTRMNANEPPALVKLVLANLKLFTLRLKQWLEHLDPWTAAKVAAGLATAVVCLLVVSAFYWANAFFSAECPEPAMRSFLHRYRLNQHKAALCEQVLLMYEAWLALMWSL